MGVVQYLLLIIPGPWAKTKWKIERRKSEVCVEVLKTLKKGDGQEDDSIDNGFSW